MADSAESAAKPSLPEEGQQTEQEKKENWKAAKNYYYWHGHGKDKAKEGDVAPMPVPVLVSKEEAAKPIQLPPKVVKKYSWSDGEKSVSIYVETIEEPGDVLDLDSVQVSWKKKSFHLQFAVTTATGARKERTLFLHLSHEVQPDGCSHKFKESSKQIYLRAVKESPSTWHELVGKPPKGDNDSDDE